MAQERFLLGKDRGRLLRTVPHRSAAVRTRFDHRPNKLQLTFPHNTLASHSQCLSIATGLLWWVLSKPTSNPASPHFTQQSSIMASNEALGLENRFASSAYPKQVRDTSSQVHAKLFLSQHVLKPPRIPSATIPNTSGLSGAPCDTSCPQRYSRNNMSQTDFQRTATPPAAEHSHRLWTEVFAKQCCRGKYDQMLS